MLEIILNYHMMADKIMGNIDFHFDHYEAPRCFNYCGDKADVIQSFKVSLQKKLKGD